MFLITLKLFEDSLKKHCVEFSHCCLCKIVLLLVLSAVKSSNSYNTALIMPCYFYLILSSLCYNSHFSSFFLDSLSKIEENIYLQSGFSHDILVFSSIHGGRGKLKVVVVFLYTTEETIVLRELGFVYSGELTLFFFMQCNLNSLFCNSPFYICR